MNLADKFTTMTEPSCAGFSQLVSSPIRRRTESGERLKQPNTHFAVAQKMFFIHGQEAWHKISALSSSTLSSLTSSAESHWPLLYFCYCKTDIAKISVLPISAWRAILLSPTSTKCVLYYQRKMFGGFLYSQLVPASTILVDSLSSYTSISRRLLLS
jgi:hypothetical protein